MMVVVMVVMVMVVMVVVVLMVVIVVVAILTLRVVHVAHGQLVAHGGAAPQQLVAALRRPRPPGFRHVGRPPVVTAGH